MDYNNAKPHYVGGIIKGIVCDNTSWLVEHDMHQEFINWLAQQNKTFEQWLSENPYQSWGNLTLEEYKAQRISELDLSVRNYVYSHYEQHRQVTLTKLQFDANRANKSAAFNYIENCWTWIRSAFTVYYVTEAQINACLTHQALQDISWNLTVLDSTDPKVTIQHALELLNS